MRQKLLFAFATTAVVLGGCSSTVRHYTDINPITVRAARPAPPPAPEPPRMTRIQVDESIFFHNGSARIQRESFPIVDEVAIVINEHPEITLIRIEGHTDRAGNARFNQRLSQRRAEAVRQRLIFAGVHPGRLEAVGYGDEQPIADNETRVGRTQNRRVEFIVVNQEG